MSENNFLKCGICNEYHWTDGKCNPIFYFKHESWGDDFQEIRGFDFEDAAKKFAELYNQDEYTLMGESIDVLISDGKTEKIFTVSAEPDVYYSATEKE